jgi:hypothetical protein
MATGAERQAKYFNKLKRAAAEVVVLRHRIRALEAAKAPTAKSRHRRSSRARPSNAQQRDTL